MAFCSFIVILCLAGLLDVDWHGAFRGICFSCSKVIAPAARRCPTRSGPGQPALTAMGRMGRMLFTYA